MNARYVWLVSGFDGNEHYPVMVFANKDVARELGDRLGGDSSVEQILFLDGDGPAVDSNDWEAVE